MLILELLSLFSIINAHCSLGGRRFRDWDSCFEQGSFAVCSY